MAQVAQEPPARTSRPAQRPGTRARGLALSLLGLWSFLLVVEFGNPPQATGLDPAWSQVVAWAFLHGLQWGRDIVFTYGPLGLLHPAGAYFSGAFGEYFAGYLALPALWAVSLVLLLAQARWYLLAAFALAVTLAFPQLPADVSWIATLLFSTAFLLRTIDRTRPHAFALWLLPLAPALAAIALIKFSLLVLWFACVGAIVVACLAQRCRRCAVAALALNAAGLLLAWVACGQDPGNLPAYLRTGLEIAYGYGHAMGVRAPFAAEAGACLALGAFLATCALTAWHRRANRAALVVLVHAALAACLIWLAFMTRADEFHWPQFFIALGFVPFTLWTNPLLRGCRALAAGMSVVFVICIAAGLVAAPVARLPSQAARRIAAAIDALRHPLALRRTREEEWRALQRAAALPRIRQRIGDGRVDLLTWQQSQVLLNGLNYAPRPVFQSYSAYTPGLARLNEAYFRGPSAPQFALLHLDYADGRMPASEDGLALIALLERYRPLLLENDLLLLQRAVGAPAPLQPPEPARHAALGADIVMPALAAPTAAFIRLDLNWFGKMYTSLVREPELRLALTTDSGEQRDYRFVRSSAASGFLLSPVVASSRQWLRLYFSKTLPRVASLRVDTTVPWDRLLYRDDVALALAPVEPLTARAPLPPELAVFAAPEFVPAPTEPARLRMIEEDGHEAAFIHAPGALTFEPAAGNYTASATFGIQEAAVKDATCVAANPNGVGIWLVRLHGAVESQLWHGTIDPFHVARDRGPQRLQVDDFDIADGDLVVYRVDPGPDPKNVSCDWSYVRDFRLHRRGGPGWREAHRSLIFEGSFD